MRFFVIILSAFIVFSCSDSNKEKKSNLKQQDLFKGLGTIDIPSDYIIDDYNKAQNQVPEIRFKNKTNSRFITIKRINKIFNNLGVVKSMMEQEAEATDATVYKSGFQDINGREYYVKESEVSIGGVPTYKIDGLTILNQDVLTIVFSCAAEEKQKWNTQAKEVFFTLKINE